jgi:integrase/recombinase XerC
MSEDYYKTIDHERTLRLRELFAELPPYARDFFRSVETTTSALTRLNYAYDLRLFFNYLSTECSKIGGKAPADITLDQLSSLDLTDFEIYVEYLGLYLKDDKEIENASRGKARKIASLRSFFKYFHKKGLLVNNVCALIDMPKIHEKPIVRLEPNEVADLLDLIEQGTGLTAKQLDYHELTKKRDLALVTFLLATGIRVSELVGLNIGDFDFINGSFKTTRKGGNEVILYFGEEAEKALADYLDERKNQKTYGLDEPLFLNVQKQRLGVRSVENLVKKYARLAAPLKNISPHKLRSTFGTALYQETGDIYLVADVLGHKDVNTTRKHYASIVDDRRKSVKNAVKLRD